MRGMGSFRDSIEASTVSPMPPTVASRAGASVEVAPRLRDVLTRLAGGRALVIDYFATGRCGAVVGDLTAEFWPEPPGDGYLELATVGSVRVFAEARLVGLLEEAGPGLDLAGLPFARHVAVTLERPERWLEFLERPGVCAGKRPWRGRRRR